ncbi:MAG: glycoside hydrolase family 18 protein [Candidatus Gracilibacteria bacterium]|jgi:hypothetical protein
MEKNKIKKIVLFCAIIFAFILFLYFFVGIGIGKPGSFYNKGKNAVWLSHKWVGERTTDQEVNDLVNRLEKYQISLVFVHAGPLDVDGTISPERYKYALSFLEKAKKFDKDIQYQAWLGQVRKEVDISDPKVQHNIGKQALIFANLIGFDGVHFDIEPVWDGDSNFIDCLKIVRESIGNEKTISVALAEFIPRSIIWMLEDVKNFKNYNSEVNYKNVAQYADQIIVMAYDTGINNAFVYRWLLREQTIWLTNLLKSKELFVGIPAYAEPTPGFNPLVENIENGLKGIISGLNNIRSADENFAGVAIYPYWEMNNEKWAVYEDLWLK